MPSLRAIMWMPRLAAWNRRHAAVGVIVHFRLRHHHRQLALERQELLIAEQILGAEARAVDDDRLAQRQRDREACRTCA